MKKNLPPKHLMTREELVRWEIIPMMREFADDLWSESKVKGKRMDKIVDRLYGIIGITS